MVTTLKCTVRENGVRIHQNIHWGNLQNIHWGNHLYFYREEVTLLLYVLECIHLTSIYRNGRTGLAWAVYGLIRLDEGDGSRFRDELNQTL